VIFSSFFSSDSPFFNYDFPHSLIENIRFCIYFLKLLHYQTIFISFIFFNKTKKSFLIYSTFFQNILQI
jgi:hypothetical protein